MRVGEPITTFCGTFWPLDPRAEDVDVVDVAHHLSVRCRFSGELYDFYSVAQHAVLVSRVAHRLAINLGATPDQANEIALYGLWRDAYLAYLPSVARSLKNSDRFGFFVPELEVPVQRACYAAIGLDFDAEPVLVQQSAALTFHAEIRDLGRHPDPLHALAVENANIKTIRAKSPREAELLFLRRFLELDQARRRGLRR